MQQDITITIDGRRVVATHHESALKAIGKLGIFVPALCDHDDLEPAGACRLCLIEVVKNKRRKFVTACNYPVEDGVELVTRSDQLTRHRRNVMELLLARCPESPALQKLGVKLGVESLRHRQEDDTCILCGLCTRMCESYATSAIATVNRGTQKAVGTPADEPPADCVGCGGCVKICPTGHIQEEQTAGCYRVWEREFSLATCVVHGENCIGCGACEEACPFSVPRVVLKKDTPAQADISAASCRGCGVCAAACPAGAIEAPRFDRALPMPAAKTEDPQTLVIGCDRNDFNRAGLDRTTGIQTLIVPCVGTVSPAMLLGAIALGFDGVLVLGRHEASCRLEGSEAHAVATVERTATILDLLGMGAERLLFAEPGPTASGVNATVRAFKASVPRSPLGQTMPSDLHQDGPFGAAAAARWLAENGPAKDIDEQAIISNIFGEWLPKAAQLNLDLNSACRDALLPLIAVRRGAWQSSHKEAHHG